MNTERTTQLTKLWEWLPRPTSGHVLRLFARDASGGVIGDYARSLKELYRFVESLDGRYNIYVGLNPTTSTAGTRHSAGDVTHWSFFPVDIDPNQPDADPRAAARAVSSAMEKTFGVVPSAPAIIDSGRGIQLWYRLRDYMLDDSGVVPLFTRLVPRRTMQYWLNQLADIPEVKMSGCCIDTSVSDLPRVMRCPGTINLKTGRRSSIMQPLGEILASLGWDMVQATPPKTFDTAPGIMVHSSAPWQTTFHHLTRRAQEYLTQGKEEPGRHAAMWHTVKKFHEIGVSMEQARAAVTHANNILGPDSALPAGEIERTLTAIYGEC